MNKYNEALEWLLKVFTSYLRVAYPPQISNKLERTREAISTIKELVERTTPPTEEEVCNALSEWFEKEWYSNAKIVCDKDEYCIMFTFSNDEREFDIVWYNVLDKNIEFNDEIYLPPKLIKMIGWFYEGLQNIGQ